MVAQHIGKTQTSSKRFKREPSLRTCGKSSLNLSNGGSSLPLHSRTFLREGVAFIMQKPARGKATGGGTPLGGRLLQTRCCWTGGQLGCSPFHAQHQAPLTHLPQVSSVLGIQPSLHFLCDYYDNSNVGQIKINQTGIFAFSEITKTVCVKQGCSHIPQKQSGYLKYHYWNKENNQV